jgi:hypothetical protein
LHIGLEKTGSTSIQATLAKNRELLLAQGVLYPRSLGERSHVKLYTFASDGDLDEIKFQCGLRDATALGEFRRGIFRDLESEISGHDPRTVCISNEHCSSRLHSLSEIERVRDLIAHCCSSVSIIIYLRAQGDSHRSAYSTYVKTGGVGPFEYPTDQLIDGRYDYDAIIEKWATVFGPDNLDVRLFDDERLAGGDVVTDFIEKLALEAPISAFSIESQRNVSLSRFSIEFLRSINKYIPYRTGSQMNPVRGNLHELVEQFGDDTPFEGDIAIMTALDQAMSAGNERIRQRYFPQMEGPLFKPTRPSPVVKAPIAPIPEAGIRLMARLWEAKQQQVLQLRQRLEQRGKDRRPAGARDRPGSE